MTTTVLGSYLGGSWREPSGARTTLYNPATEAPLAEIGATTVDWAATLDEVRAAGAALRALTFAERGALLRTASKIVHANRDELLALAMANGGNTRGDAKFDVDGASGTLAAYAELGAQLGARRFLVDGEAVQLTRSVRFYGQHILVPRAGVAVHINAFNFPAWNMMEKAAVALLAGVPVVEKPATATALVAHRIVELLVAADALPKGALSLLLGPVGDLLAHLGPQDGVAFTGSSDTGRQIRGHANLVARSVRVNVEADSLNAAVLGPDAARDSEAYAQFIADVVRDMTQKTGQKCTAIRRVLVPAERRAEVAEDIGERLAAIKVGDPALEEVGMGPLATRQQLDDVRAGIARLGADADAIFGGDGRVTALGVPAGKGWFVSPVLLSLRDGAGGAVVHGHEVFGPVATLLPYRDVDDAAAQIARGQGSLVSSVYSDDRAFLGAMTLATAPWLGRLFLGSSKLSGHAVGPGTVLPQLMHGGPGRAGGGEELGGVRGLGFYLQRTAVAGDRPILDALFETKKSDEKA